MSSIPVAICRFFDINFKRFYLNKKRLFLNFFLYFQNVHKIWNIVKKKKSILA